MKDARESAEKMREINRPVPEGLVVAYGDTSNRAYDHPSGRPAVAAAIEAVANTDPHAFSWWGVVNVNLKPTTARRDARRHLEEEKIRILQNGAVDPRHHYKARAEIA